MPTLTRASSGIWQQSGCIMKSAIFWMITLSAGVAAAQICPKRCLCQNLAPSLAILCAKTGLLFVPSVIDRRTVELRLTDNFITIIRRKDFTNMTRLLHLTLSRNMISHITPYTFADLRGLRALHLDNNRILSMGDEQLKGLLNLRHLILSNNQLSNISPASFQDFVGTLEDLDLSYNNLIQVPWQTIAKLNNVNSLSLDHNLIEFVPGGVFTNLHKLARLDMTSNKLKTIPPDPLFLRIPVYAKSKGSPLSSLVLGFGGNPLHCNCELLWLRRLTREDDLETCASPPNLLGKYFWSISEEEFMCDPPVVTHHSGHSLVMEGEWVVLKCKAVGDPEPSIHWVSPEGKVVSNSSRAVSYENGTLEFSITMVRDSGSFTCIASNTAGDATASVELTVSPLPHPSNASHRGHRLDRGPSDILTQAKAGSPHNDSSSQSERKVITAQLSHNTALIQWFLDRNIPGIRMYQLQYNSSADDSLIYRMIPPSNRSYLVNDLAPGREYDLCVLAVYDDGMTSLTATRVVGCVQFSTKEEAGQCQPLHAQFLGGTMIIIIGGIIVASVLVFIIILMIRYKVYSGQDEGGKARVSNVYSQTNGQQAMACAHSCAKLGENKYEPLPPTSKDPPVKGKDAGKREDPPLPVPLTELDKRRTQTSNDLQTVALLSSLSGDGDQTETSALGSTTSLCLISSEGQCRIGPKPTPRTYQHRFSFDGDYTLFQSHSYPRRARTKRHMSTSELHTQEAALGHRRVAFSSTEWMLESTV